MKVNDMAAKKWDVLVIGELNVDLILKGLPSLPALGKELLAAEMTFTTGSSSAIFAYGLARLGLKVGFIGKAGKDFYGSFLIDYLRQAGIDVSLIRNDENIKTGVTISLSFPRDRALLTYPGSTELLTFKDIDPAIFNYARHLHLSSYFLQRRLKKDVGRLFQMAREKGLTTSFDTGFDPAEKWNGEIFEVLSNTSIFLPNEIELLAITRSPTIKGAMKLLSSRVDITVAKRGEKGAVAQRGEKIIYQKAFPVEVVDTTGAGDAFNAGFISAYLQGMSLQECLCWGNACGAIACTAAGGTTALPTRKKLRSFLKDKVGGR